MKKTALYEMHLKHQGRMIDFGGWNLPVQYTGLAEEHLACRTAAGIFDVSHMGEVWVTGSGAFEFLQYLITNDLRKIQDGQAQYTAMCLDSGGIVDDLLVYRLSAEKFFLVVNASNDEKDFAHLQSVLSRYLERNPSAKVKLQHASQNFTQIALQGPRAEEILRPLVRALDQSKKLADLKTYWFFEAEFGSGVPAIVARTGYTGEDGFELYVPWEAGAQVWGALFERGEPLGLKPCGLGARDTLRMEMKYALYGNEIDDSTHPLEAGLGWITSFEKGDFVGREAILAAQQKGLTRRLVGLRLKARGIARSGYRIASSTDFSQTIGKVTSGTHSPSLKESIAIAYLQSDAAKLGTEVLIDIRGTPVAAEVVKTPFLKKEIGKLSSSESK